MTKLTWIESAMGPTEMWVEANTAHGYKSQGFVMVEYDPPPEWLSGCYSGRMKIRKPGSECIHVWSPELAGLHKFVGENHSTLYDGVDLLTPTGKALSAASHRLYTELEYHETLMRVEKHSDGPLEVPQGRVVAAIRRMASEERVKKAAVLLTKWANAVEQWKPRGSSDPSGE